MTLIGGEEKAPYCLPPNIEPQLLGDKINLIEERQRLVHLLGKWRKNIPKLAENICNRMNKVVQHSKDNDEEYKSAWMTLKHFLTEVIALGKCKTNIADAIRDTVCDVILSGRVKDSKEYSKISVDLLEKLHKDEKGVTHCQLPDILPNSLCENINPFERNRLRQLLEK
jgi:hypothetical protein